MPNFVFFQTTRRSSKKLFILIQWLAIKVFYFLFYFSVEYTLMLLPVEHLSTMPQTITAALGRAQ